MENEEVGIGCPPGLRFYYLIKKVWHPASRLKTALIPKLPRYRNEYEHRSSQIFERPGSGYGGEKTSAKNILKDYN
jgi:hypothetical protein